MDILWRPLLENVVLFGILVTCVTVVYHGLRRESVKEIVRVGISRSIFFFVTALLVFGVGLYFLAELL